MKHNDWDAICHEVFDRSNDILLIISLEGQVLEANSTAVHRLGYSLEELKRMSVVEIDTAEAAAGVAQRIAITNEHGHAVFETTHRTRDGATIPTEVSTSVIDYNGTPAILGICRDISTRRHIEELLREAAEKYRNVVNNAGDGICVAQDGFLKFVNPAAISFFGYSQIELTTKPFLEIIHPDDRQRVAAIAQSRIQGLEVPPWYEFRVLSKDGEYRWVRNRAVVIDWEGRPAALSFLTDITDQKLADEALRTSEERYRFLFTNMLEGYAHCKMIYRDGVPHDFLYLDVNETFEKLTGLHNAAGKLVSELIPGIRESNPDLFEIYGRVALTGRPERFETYVAPLSMWFSTSVYSPTREHFVAVFDVVTERKRAEEALRESENQLRAMFELASVGIAQADPRTGRWLRVNRKMCEITGYRAPELLSMQVWDITHPEDREKDARLFERVVRGELPEYRLEKRYVRKDGTSIWVNVNMTLVRDADGRVTRTITAVEDISERKRAEDELRTSEARFRSYFDLPLYGIAMSSREKRWIQVNDRLCSILGYSREELLTLTWPEITHPEDVEANVLLFERVLAGESDHYNLEKRFIRKDGTVIWTRLSAGAVREADGELAYLVVLVEDISEKKAAEEALEHSRAQLFQAQKMEAIGRLAGGVAHDFNNLLQAMLTHIELFRAAPRSRDVELVDLEAQIHRGASLARQLLLFSRPEVARRDVLDLNDVIQDAASLLRRLLRENVELVVSLGEGPLALEGDRGQLGQVLMNLALNAAGAMPTGGLLTVRTGRAGAEVWFEAEDTGSGIPPEIRDRVFEPFFTTKAPGQGSGLGLSVVHGIILSHGGRVELESEVGKGTRFRAVLPGKIDDPEPRQTPPSATATLPAGHGERVLIVEDEVAARQGLAEILVLLDYEVTAVGSAAAAGRLPADRPFDVLLTDLMLPDIDGAALARGLVDRWPELKVILMSGYGEEEALRHVRELGHVIFLQKPFDLATLAQAVRDTLPQVPSS